MLQSNPQSEKAPDIDRELTIWLHELNGLVDLIEQWSKAQDWICRRITARIRDSRYGEYQAPGLMMQKDDARLRLEPVSGNVIGAQGVVDLYIVPAYDDLASFYLRDGNWEVNYLWRDSKPVVGQFSLQDIPAEPLTKENFSRVIEEMARHAGIA